MNFSRRLVLGGGLASGAMLALSPSAFAERKMPSWHAGYATAPAKGFDPAPMNLVSGKPPAGLSGALYRNGPAQFRYGDTFASHWFDGDGMVHRIAIQDGKAIHTGRFVATNKRRQEQAAQKFLAPGFGTGADPSFSITGPDDANAANTSVLMSGGEMLALWEGGSAFRLDPVTLETRGPRTWRPDLRGMPFLAHPKREPDGRVWNLGVNGRRVGIYRISPSGELEDFDVVDIGAASYIHDWTMSERKLIILVQPWVLTTSRPSFINSFDWRPQEGLKALIIDKDDLKKTRWAQAPARSFYHTGAAWEESDGTIRLDAAFYPAPVLGQGGGVAEINGTYVGEEGEPSKLTQMVIPPQGSGGSGDARLVETGLSGDFPQVDPRLHGLPRRLTALVGGGAPKRPGATTLYLHDWASGQSQTYDYGVDHMAEEHLFIPKPGSTNERDSWLIGTAINIKAGRSEVSVFDAADIGKGPLATWQADYSWPLGFHGTWAGA